MSPNSIISEDGFSLVEMLVAMTITTILIGFAFGIYLFGQRLFLQWQDQLFLQNELHTLSHSISEELFRADRIINLESQKLILLKEGKKKKYEVQNDSLLMNGKNILNQSSMLVAFKFSSQNKDDKPINESNSKSIGKITFIKFKLALTDGRDTLQIKRSLNLRKPSNWKTLRNNK